MRRAHYHEPGQVWKLQVVAVAALADEQAVVFQALLGARGAEARRRRIELDLQEETPAFFACLQPANSAGATPAAPHRHARSAGIARGSGPPSRARSDSSPSCRRTGACRGR